MCWHERQNRLTTPSQPSKTAVRPQSTRLSASQTKEPLKPPSSTVRDLRVARACAFDLLILNGDDLTRKTFAERKTALRKLLKHEPNGIQYVEHTEGDGDGDGDAMFEAVCKLGLEGIASKKLTAPYRSGLSKGWIKVNNPKAPAAIRVIEEGF